MQQVIDNELKLDICLQIDKLNFVVEDQLESLLNDWNDEHDDHDGVELRLRTIEIVVAEVNSKLSGSGQQLYRFAEFEGWETGEPLWLLLTPGEREQILAMKLLVPA